MEIRPYTTDTADEADRLQLEIFGRMSPTERIQKVCRLSSNLRQMARDAIQRRHPELDKHEQRLKYIEITYGKELADAVREHTRERASV
jgi:proline racemase